jgi:protein AbiQ
MKLKKLDSSFYSDNTHLVEILDCLNGNWQTGKIRGYGVVVISINSLTFAIPLRSNIRHHAAYITVKSAIRGVKGKGLDFSKALLISKTSHVSNELFKISSSEFKSLKNKEVFITQKFEKYVDHYIKAVNASDQHILQNDEYRFSTLINYHTELGL